MRGDGLLLQTARNRKWKILREPHNKFNPRRFQGYSISHTAHKAALSLVSVGSQPQFEELSCIEESVNNFSCCFLAVVVVERVYVKPRSFSFQQHSFNHQSIQWYVVIFFF